MGAGALALGESGSGMLDVSAGARVLSEGGWLGVRSGGFGTFLLSGQDTEWRAGSAAVVLGDRGVGALALAKGAKATTGAALLGRQLGALGVASIDDAGSEWTTGSQLIVVGASGTGMLTIAGKAS